MQALDVPLALTVRGLAIRWQAMFDAQEAEAQTQLSSQAVQ